MLRVSLYVLGVLLVLGLVCSQDSEEWGQGGGHRRGRFLNRTVRRIFGFNYGHRDCGDPEACPPHHCRLDDAVVHGFCCGCAHPTDRVHVRCPPWLQCPISPIPLCDDYNYMMDCCC